MKPESLHRFTVAVFDAHLLRTSTLHDPGDAGRISSDLLRARPGSGRLGSVGLAEGFHTKGLYQKDPDCLRAS